ncbi:hypothetical protein ACFVZH_37105 [Streptomyces sp. NPDC059534]|uniref:hypothetical protein n=1 Tax=Streptomyces sp. NPDC059534 TaxID=3346859 RepID=UPI00369059B3
MSTTSSGPYDWASDTDNFAPRTEQSARPSQPPRQRPSDSFSDWPDEAPAPRPARPRPSRATGVAEAAGTAAGAFIGGVGGSVLPPVNVTVNRGGGQGGSGGNGGGRGAAPAGGGADRHQGDRMIYAIEKIEIRSDRDILALAKAINHLGRELHLILGMRAEEINGVLSTYKGKWYTFGASSRVRARLVSAHLKVSAEAAKALGVGALKMAAAFDRHFVKPEAEAKSARSGKTAPKKTFTIGGE